jgi:hypothetical protein
MQAQMPFNPDSVPAKIVSMGDPHYHLKCFGMRPTAPAWMGQIGSNHMFIYEVSHKNAHKDYLKMVTADFKTVVRFPCYATGCLKDGQIDDHFQI